MRFQNLKLYIFSSNLNSRDLVPLKSKSSVLSCDENKNTAAPNHL
jgi:hypothetical protein